MSWLDAPQHAVVVDGARVVYRRLGRPDGPSLMLIHGGAAHSGWWIDVVPELLADYTVIVPELSGHGDSDHRLSYSTAQWAGEMEAILLATGVGPAHVVAHSLGGFVTIETAARSPALVRSALLIDTALERRASTLRPLSESRTRHYESVEAGIAHFRLRPRGTIADAQTLERVARLGLHEDAEGWRWKFDPRALGRISREELASSIRAIRCSVSFIYGEHSESCDARTVEYLEAGIGHPVPHAVIPGAFHHVPLDAPAATVAAIRWSDAAEVSNTV